MIRLRDIKKNYLIGATSLEVLKGIDVDVEEGGFIAVMGPSGSHVTPAQREKRVLEVLEKTGISHRSKHNPNELSGGEQQRVAIARALVMNPSVILADEPTGNLDSRSGAEIMNIFKELNEEGVTVILVTHEMDIAKSAKKVMTIKDGVCSSGCY
ncbi:MAG: ATP-binding cassette domain-containing protein [Nitrospirae bacterium]|nr:ATP-binding cassette domain-containing protein [Nitrospirota bacterium]